MMLLLAAWLMLLSVGYCTAQEHHFQPPRTSLLVSLLKHRHDSKLSVVDRRQQRQQWWQQQQKQHQQQHHDPFSLLEVASWGSWLSQCCSHKQLRQLYLPGTHDSGTYRWTLPTHLPMVVDEVAAITFDVVGELSRTQQLTVYQ